MPDEWKIIYKTEGICTACGHDTVQATFQRVYWHHGNKYARNETVCRECRTVTDERKHLLFSQDAIAPERRSNFIGNDDRSVQKDESDN